MNTKTSNEQTMNVYQAINAVQKELAVKGLAKSDSGDGLKYKFRGIDSVYNVLAPLLASHGLCILPRMVSREVMERTSSRGNSLFYVTLEAEFDFVSAHDGSKHTMRTFGEAMDSGDKATNKAMSAAYKYAAFQTFCIPTEGDNDADAASHEVEPAKRITSEQAVEIRKALSVTDLTEDRLCKAVRLKSLDDLEASRFQGAMDYIRKHAGVNGHEQRAATN